ncbi:hypothetical protein ITP53_47035, partial [Nonomuraea sp. K274]|nr:hypothetical protein [Nonomuraea cypriaca]
MSRSVLLVSLAAGSLVAPAPAYSAATEPVIRAINVRPAEPVVGAHDSIRLVIDVVATGATGKDGVTVKVEPGAPHAPLLTSKPPITGTPAQSPTGRSPAGQAPAPARPARPEPRPMHP